MRPRGLTRYEVMELARESAYRTEAGCLIPTLWRPMSNGYVRVMVDGKLISLHRLAMDAPPDLTVDHECHNRDLQCSGVCIHRRCIEVTHLVLRGSVENWKRGRGHPIPGSHCPAGHPYSGSNLRITPRGHRRCRACHRAKMGGRDPSLEPVVDSD